MGRSYGACLEQAVQPIVACRKRGVHFVLDPRTPILRNSDHDVGTPGFDRILALDIRSLATEVYSTSVEVTTYMAAWVRAR